MMTAALFALLAQAAAPAKVPDPSTAQAPAAAPDPRTVRLAALYDEVCLKAFPDDRAVERAVTARGGVPMTPEQVRVTLVDDPGRGWRLRDDGREVLIFLELPPYHACSVRWNDPAGPADLRAYRAVADPYIAARSGWTTLPPMEMDRGDVHISATMIGRMSPSGTDSLMVFEQAPADPARRAAGEGGVDRRYVHQMRER